MTLDGSYILAFMINNITVSYTVEIGHRICIVGRAVLYHILRVVIDINQKTDGMPGARSTVTVSES